MAPARQQSSLPAGYKEDLAKGAMLRFEDSLPRLPVPTLEETAKRYLKSVHPLLSKEQFENTTKCVKEFVAPGGPGEELQKRLIARRENPEIRNWLSEWWNDAAYMAYRDPVVPYVSYFYSHRDDRKRRDPAKRAAAISTAVLEFKKAVDNGSLEPEYMKKLPIAMSSYKWMFNCCRIPRPGSDTAVKYEAKDSAHIIVVRNNQFWKVAHEIDGKQLNTRDLETQFRRIYDSGIKNTPVGLLTTQNRDVWAKVYSKLRQNDLNSATLKDIESASFVVCLDDARPVTLEERARQYWHGDGANRWFDKPLQFIINDNGTSGFMGEHSMMDGTPTHRLNDEVCRMIFTEALPFDDPNVRPDLPHPTPLEWQIDQDLLQDVEDARRHFLGQINNHDLRVQAYQAYGKGLIKKFKCSPDAYVQMIIQLAYYKMFGVNRPTYESAATRRFQEGRTETCRSVSDESVAFCKALGDHSTSPEKARELFRAALDAHVKYISDASDGRGVDRHLFGLKKCLKEGEPVPALYQDPAYSYSGKWYISSSQLSSEFFNGYGWSQVVDDGFGIAYMINENSLQFNVVCKVKNLGSMGAQRMSFYLNEAAGDIRDLMLPTLEAPKAKL
ncbi:acyltransferase ChoActase/COT/CPT [Westerdykella ornata]|uniref:Carnitine O-acetyltransferase, mitochondrial n=1 Tax=Westerdykella ornata TaxID=318751 RepID=A0A6A6JRP8_WESOR|nr:acyltransferase ChoActase/COT/CPT [Westerdykella ornata]KAF2279242.1 acyltransferase ChoActase/COT/CPT [Westerdykella ornata]